jgi:hypothetical protein
MEGLGTKDLVRAVKILSVIAAAIWVLSQGDLEEIQAELEAAALAEMGGNLTGGGGGAGAGGGGGNGTLMVNVPMPSAEDVFGGGDEFGL